MFLDERSFQLLKEITLTHGMKIKDLEKKFQLTRSQINYSLKKINDWLAVNHLPKINNSKQTGIEVEPSVKEMFPDLVEKTPLNEYVPSENERINLILVMLVSRSQELSLFHFSNSINVSRNTVLSDLKKAETLLNRYDLKLVYTRRHGYYLEGGEIQKRLLLLNLVPKILKMKSGEKWLVRLTEICKKDIKSLASRFEIIEKKVKIKFTDEKLKELPYLLLLLLRRMQRGKQLNVYDIHFSDISNTKEYHLVEDLLWNIAEVHEQDRLFLTLQLLSSSVLSVELNKENDQHLVSAIKDLLLSFEKQACVTVQNRDGLIEKLFQHMKPAVYRIAYGLTTENPLLKDIQIHHGDVHHLVRKSLDPLETFLGKTIPEDELAYLTILIKSWLQQQGEKLTTKLKAVVVCPNGISVSKLLLETLREMFSDIIFLDCISVREFNHYALDFDLVFSSVTLKTNKKLFLVKPFITEEEEKNLKLRVYQELHGYSPSKIDYEMLMEVIQEHANITNVESLKKSLHSFFHNSNMKYGRQHQLVDPNLADLLKEDVIVMRECVTSWEEAIQVAAHPLLKNKSIEASYIEQMISQFNPEEPYIIIAPKVAIPHASPEDGVNNIAMSMLCLQEGVEFAPQLTVNVVIVIAAIDRKKHLQALFQLNELVENEENISQMINAKSKKEITELVNYYANVKVTI
ncbi:hypothetical protein BKP45_14560 [Anaerobacillus alkalidiazotrophicus]|uniref:Ascorbate-specific PTS system EIIA component n=1 Tax=Anaerobacillus alkalidiazotrophicus TaxID=472963 RepID=A0A1S2M4Z8_9BACI|nr:BglG family transcription antiterminator [Anaerobacillus alkalidiazotrophicus]OIJ18947.1 hypothetical protein BKP45_14560 [Anaerobacillus alkalidiazotrophicus]